MSIAVNRPEQAESAGSPGGGPARILHSSGGIFVGKTASFTSIANERCVFTLFRPSCHAVHIPMPLMLRNKAMKILAATLFFMTIMPLVCAGQTADRDVYKWRIDGSWWFSNPTGSIHASGNTGEFDLSKDFHFGSYSTFTGKIDWHFKRKHHFILGISPVTSSNSATLTRNIEFQGVTYDVGAQVSASIQSLSFSPGYQYDIIRGNRGYLGIATQIFLLNTKATLKGVGSVNGVSATRSASGSTFDPLPALGPRGRWYPLPNSSRLSLDGYAQGMYFFGYGDFATAQMRLGVEIHRHWTVRAGYQLGTLLDIHGSSNQIGLRLIQKGPVAGIEASW
jgi:hypothetical protein